jgi:hypothetical protein
VIAADVCACTHARCVVATALDVESAATYAERVGTITCKQCVLCARTRLSVCTHAVDRRPVGVVELVWQCQRCSACSCTGTTSSMCAFSMRVCCDVRWRVQPAAGPTSHAKDRSSYSLSNATPARHVRAAAARVRSRPLPCVVCACSPRRSYPHRPLVRCIRVRRSLSARRVAVLLLRYVVRVCACTRRDHVWRSRWHRVALVYRRCRCLPHCLHTRRRRLHCLGRALSATLRRCVRACVCACVCADVMACDPTG